MRRSTRRALMIVGIAIIVELFMLLTGMGPDVLLVAAAVAAVGIGAWFVIETAEAVPAVAPIGVAPRQQPEHRVDRRVTRLRSALAHAQTDSLSAERLHTSLVGIIDDQLLAGHQIDRGEEPDAAAALVGPELARFIEDPAYRAALPGTRDLDRIVTQIERL